MINLQSKDYLEIPTFKSIIRGKEESSGIIKSVTCHKGSSLVYMDITFMTNNNDSSTYNEFPQFLHVDLIVFQNYYTSSIRIIQQSSKGVNNIIYNKALMPNPYVEDGSQSWFTIRSNEFNSNYLNGKPIRIILFQPGDLWNTFEIKNFSAYCCSKLEQHQDKKSISINTKDINNNSFSSSSSKPYLSIMIKNDYQRILEALKQQNETKEYPSDKQPNYSSNYKRSGKKKDKKKN